jgi:hypothetical protein
MAARGSARSAKLSRWGVTVDNLRGDLDQFPHIAPDLEEMERTLGLGRDLESRVDALRGQLREVGAELRTLTDQGEKLRARLGAHLKAKYGFTSESLVRYGFRPLSTIRRRPLEKKPKAGEETAEKA